MLDLRNDFLSSKGPRTSNPIVWASLGHIGRVKKNVVFDMK